MKARFFGCFSNLKIFFNTEDNKKKSEKITGTCICMSKIYHIFQGGAPLKSLNKLMEYLEKSEISNINLKNQMYVSSLFKL